jgi:hypothetical protein
VSDHGFKVSPFPFLVPGIVSLLLALWAGVTRLPWALPGEALVPLHGALMVGGFLGTVISTERAAALGKMWTWLAPVCTGLGTLVMLATLGIAVAGPQAPVRAGAFLLTAGALVYCVSTLMVWKVQRTLFNLVLGLGGAAFLLANLLLTLGFAVWAVTPLWAAFLVLTIAGERLELNRLLAPRPTDLIPFHVSVFLMLVGLLAWFTVRADLGARIWGAGLVVLALWLLWKDLARKTIRMRGVTRYVAVCLLSGYVWLLLSGVLNILHPGISAGPPYDAIWHTLYVGFVLSMIFGHAPIIVPALTGIMVEFRPVFYLPLVLLHASLVARVVGDLVPLLELRRVGGLINAVVVLLFVVVLRTSLRRLPAGPND